MSDPWCTIRGMENKWYKKTYVCTMCDALVEISTKSDVLRDKDCFECNGSLNLLSVADATIQPTNERNEMDIVTMNEYYPSQSVVLKQLDGEDMKFQAYKVTELETVIHDYKQRISSLTARLESQEKQIGLILDKLTADEWYSSSTDKAEVLSDLCEILKHEPKQTIMITAQVNVEVSYDIPLDEVEDFDAKYFLQDNLTIDSWHGDVMIESYDVEDADVNW